MRAASMKDHIEIVKILLEQEGIDINSKDISFFLISAYFNYFVFKNYIWDYFKLFGTALMFASCNGNTEIVKILLEKEGIDINTKDI